MEHQANLLFRKIKYILQMSPVFNTAAIFSDETENYVSPMEPEPGDTVKIRIRTQKDNVDAVYFISGATKRKMEWEFQEGRFDYYVTEAEMGTSPLYYYFEVQSGRARCFYNKLGVSRDLQ